MPPRGLGGLALDRKEARKSSRRIEDARKVNQERQTGDSCEEKEARERQIAQVVLKQVAKAEGAKHGANATYGRRDDVQKHSAMTVRDVPSHGFSASAMEDPLASEPSWLSLYLRAYSDSLDVAAPILLMMVLMWVVFVGAPLLAILLFPVLFFGGVVVLARIRRVPPNMYLGSRYLLVFMILVLGITGAHFFAQVFMWTRDYTVEQLLFIGLFVTEPYFFWKAVKTDPGTLNQKNAITPVQNEVESSTSKYCTTCRIDRPIRAKHCGFCGRCIVRFDHHCPLIYNCVGESNQAYFLAFLTIGFAGQLIYLHLCVLSWLRSVGYSSSSNWLLTLSDLVPAFRTARAKYSMAVFWSVFHTLASPALCMLWLRQCTCMLANITTNEMVNWYRYPYLQDKQGGFLNAFDGGVGHNVKDFLSDTHVDWDARWLAFQGSHARRPSAWVELLVRQVWLSRRPHA